MHLIIFPLLMYLLITAPILLLWPQRGLSARNYWIAVGASMAGMISGFVLVILLNEYIKVGILMYAMFFAIPLVFAIFSVLKFGNKGRVIAHSESVLLKEPWSVCRAFLLSTLLATCIAVCLAILMEIDKTYIVMTVFILFPLALLLSLVQANFLAVPNIYVAFKTSIPLSLSLFAMSLVLGPYSILALPAILYGLVASFMFIYFIHRFNGPSCDS